MKTIAFTGTVDLDEVITVTELASFLRVDAQADAVILAALRQAAVNFVEDYCNVKIGQYSAVGYLDKFYQTRVPVGPVSAISEVQYYDYADSQQTLSTEKYYTDIASNAARIQFREVPTVYPYRYNGISVSMTVGFQTTAVPAPILHSLRLLVSHYYDNRNVVEIGRQVNPVPFAVESLLNPYRVLV